MATRARVTFFEGPPPPSHSLFVRGADGTRVPFPSPYSFIHLPPPPLPCREKIFPLCPSYNGVLHKTFPLLALISFATPLRRGVVPVLCPGGIILRPPHADADFDYAPSLPPEKAHPEIERRDWNVK
ncbi:hypothetical protein TNIN_27511 [Trichonephila inaurata madagascariensis]|uniref:Uncharacterized protein n=1 Tax=Trichonephila inaurata madagascariensis TaxID=2747483 RepID=A0A8X6YEV4_9ARAC|nr:hypothetical protein TNIN_27511 [Trichonephila inaurata madagascariensis]